MRFTAKQFAKLMFPMMGLCVVSATVLASFSVVNGVFLSDPHTNYYSLLDTQDAALHADLKKEKVFNLDKFRQLALVCWQNNKIEEAESYLRELWLEHDSKNTTTYDQTFVQDGLNLAGLYLDRGSNGLAETIYERLIAYDSAHLPPTDARIGRDYNNLGMCYLQTGESIEDSATRKLWFEKQTNSTAKQKRYFARLQNTVRN